MANWWDPIIKKAKPKVATASQQSKNQTAINTYSQANTGSGVNSAYSSTYRPDVLAQTQQANAAGARDSQGNPLTYGGALDYLVPRNGVSGAPASYQPPSQNRAATGASGTARRGGGGGGGGGGGVDQAALAQTQLDALLQMLGSQTWKAAPMTDVRNQIAGRQTGVENAYNKDVETATGAYGNADAWLAANLHDPYANVQLQRAQVAPDQNPYLASQGAQGLNQVTQNPDDSYGGFQNVLALLGAGQQAWNQSAQQGSQQARASTLTNLGAGRNAYNDAIQQQLAQVSQQEYTNQQTLDEQKRQAYLAAVMPLLAQGAKAPADVLAQMGWGEAQSPDPYNWAGIAAGIANGTIKDPRL